MTGQRVGFWSHSKPVKLLSRRKDTPISSRYSYCPDPQTPQTKDKSSSLQRQIQENNLFSSSSEVALRLRTEQEITRHLTLPTPSWAHKGCGALSGHTRVLPNSLADHEGSGASETTCCG